MKIALSSLCFFVLLSHASVLVKAQQVPDLSYKPKIPNPAYAEDEGLRVGIDEAHYNFHTANGRYEPFADLLGRDGYQVSRFKKKLSAKALEVIDILVIANPLHKRNDRNWNLPTPSAFTDKEIEAVKTWVMDGGSLFLIADHMPFPGGAGDLAEAFGFRFSNGFAMRGVQRGSGPAIFTAESGLQECTVTQGRSGDEQVTQVATFTGSAFTPPRGSTPVLVFGEGWISLEPEKAWEFTPKTLGRKIEHWCQGVIAEAGEGRIAVFGEAAMFTAQRNSSGRRFGMSTSDAKENYQLLLNVMHWLSDLDGME